jgi:hypothetical protein
MVGARLVITIAAILSHLPMGFILSKIRNNFVRLPSGTSPREAKVGHIKIGPLHTNLEKRGLSEPGWVREPKIICKQTLTESQEDYPRRPNDRRLFLRVI